MSLDVRADVGIVDWVLLLLLLDFREQVLYAFVAVHEVLMIQSKFLRFQKLMRKERPHRLLLSLAINSRMI